MLVIDANIWIAAYVHDDPQHQRSRAWLSRVLRRGERIAAPRILLLEIPSALARRLDDPLPQYTMITGELQRPAMRWTDLDQSLLTQAIDIALDIRVRTADCLYVAAAEHLNVPLYTWDEEVLKRAPKRIRVYKPE